MTQYNVECVECGHVSTVSKDPLWWRAKKAADTGRLDAISISGVECGCQQPVRNPDAPYRVLGFTDEGSKFDEPFDTFVAAVESYRAGVRLGETVFIKGVSPAVADRLEYS